MNTLATALASSGLILLQVCNAQPTFRIAGSSTVFPVAEQWATSLASEYSFVVDGGGSSTGARRVCAPRDDPEHVDIGDMSRDWKSSEAVRLDDGYTLECLSSGNRVTQIVVGVDGLAVVVKKNGAGHACLTNPAVGGLTLAQLRWMFSDWSNAQLEADGVDISSVVPGDDGDDIKEWSDISSACPEVPVNPYGAGDQSGTHDFFAETVLCEDCFAQEAGYTPEYFTVCDSQDIHELENYSATDTAGIQSWISANRKPNCYMPSEDDELIFEWLLADAGGVGYFGYAYFAQHAAELTVARIASDRSYGVQDTADAKIEPSSYTITDGSYAVFARSLFMNVDNSAWQLAHKFLEYGFTDVGQAQVANVGYVTVNAALRAKMDQRIAEGLATSGNVQADYVPVPPSMCWNGTELKTALYLNQWGKQKTNYTCAPCSLGTAKRENTATDCYECAAGSFAGQTGLSECSFCGLGKFSAFGSVGCTECPRNEIASLPGTGLCTKCDSGFYTESNGSSACLRCRQGTYRELDDEGGCQTCPAGMTTEFRGASQRSDCMCAQGSYHVSGGRQAGPCLQCKPGMLCPFGSQEDNYELHHSALLGNATAAAMLQAMTDEDKAIPLVEEGHYSSWNDPMSSYHCFSDEGCPGGQPETCNGGRLGFLCALCPTGESISDGICKPCSKGVEFGGLVSPLIGFFVVAVVYYATNAKVTSNASIILAMSIIVGISLTIMQVLSTFKDLDVTWPRELVELYGILSFALASPDTVALDCLVGQDPVGLYLFSVSVPFQLVAMVVIDYLISWIVACLWKRPCQWEVDKALNTVGGVLQAVFIAIAAITAVPFKCYDHPNGKQSMTHYPQILCYEGDDHWKFILLGFVVAIFFVIPFVAATVYGCRAVVKLTLKASTERNLVRFRFLLFRFRPDCWWWSNVCNVRQILLAFASSLPGDGHAQAIFVGGIFCVYNVLQVHFWPWKTHELNKLEAVVNCTLALAIYSFTAFIPTPTDNSIHTLWVLALISFLGFSIFYSFVMCFYYVFKHGSIKLFGVETVAGEDHKNLYQQWAFVCEVCCDMDPHYAENTIRAMNQYDRETLVRAMSVWQASAISSFQGVLSSKRLVGVVHTTNQSPRDELHNAMKKFQAGEITPGKAGSNASLSRSSLRSSMPLRSSMRATHSSLSTSNPASSIPSDPAPAVSSLGCPPVLQAERTFISDMAEPENHSYSWHDANDYSDDFWTDAPDLMIGDEGHHRHRPSQQMQMVLEAEATGLSFPVRPGALRETTLLSSFSGSAGSNTVPNMRLQSLS